jgi:hypothetical protein
MNDQFFKQVEAVLAAERLESYRQDGAGILDTLARYLWNMALCESFYSPLQMAEIALRNTVHASLADRFTADDWYLTSGVLLPWLWIVSLRFTPRVLTRGKKKSVSIGHPAWMNYPKETDPRREVNRRPIVLSGHL